MIVTKTFLDRCNTIIKDSPVNTGLNPVAELNYSKLLTRIILHFDHNKVKDLVCDKTYPDISKLKHVLKMVNCGSIDASTFDKKMLSSTFNSKKERAVSFDLIFFLIPQTWDNGRGFDYVEDLYIGSHNSLSTDGSNWYQAKNGFLWETEGIYTTNKLSIELDKFSSKDGNKSNIIIGVSHFDFGNENINLDITETFNKYITGELENYGIGIAFSPTLELTEKEFTQYVGFFTQFTNTFFEPYVETTYNEVISDDRATFYLDKPNRLYFYSNVGGFPTNLDELPICSVNGSEIASKQATKGVYYVELELSSEDYGNKEMVYDTWTSLIYKGKKLKDVELDFVTLSEFDFYQFGSGDQLPKQYVPSIRGINYDEKIKRGDIRKVIVEARIPYTTNQLQIIDNMEYRLYVNDGVRELDVISWQKLERCWNHNYLLINTNDLLPNRYKIDIKIYSNMEVKHFENILSFDIINDVTEVYT